MTEGLIHFQPNSSPGYISGCMFLTTKLPCFLPEKESKSEGWVLGFCEEALGVMTLASVPTDSPSGPKWHFPTVRGCYWQWGDCSMTFKEVNERENEGRPTGHLLDQYLPNFDGQLYIANVPDRLRSEYTFHVQPNCQCQEG